MTIRNRLTFWYAGALLFMADRKPKRKKARAAVVRLLER